MRSIHTTLFLAGAVLIGPHALARSFGPRSSVESALEEAATVVLAHLAQLVSSTQHSTTVGKDPDVITEEATFKVIETF